MDVKVKNKEVQHRVGEEMAILDTNTMRKVNWIGQILIGMSAALRH